MIKSIIVSEFHDTAGAQIILQHPNDKPITGYEDFLVPKDELCGKLMMMYYESYI